MADVVTSAKGRGTWLALAAAFFGASAEAAPRVWQLGPPEPVTPLMQLAGGIEARLAVIVVLIALVAAGLLAFTMLRFARRRNKVPSEMDHHALLQALAALVPMGGVAIFVIPSFLLIYAEAAAPKPDVTIQVTGHQWYWSYVFPHEGGLEIEARPLGDTRPKAPSAPHPIVADTVLIVPVNKVVELAVTSSDVIHGWSVPGLGVMLDAIPGRFNRGWFKATKTGTYSGLCSGQCGAGTAMMPITVKVVPEAQYRAWLAAAKIKYAESGAERLAQR